MIRCIYLLTRRSCLIFLLALLILNSSCKSKTRTIAVQQEEWKDSSGDVINAHGAGVMFYENRYYLYGEIKQGTTVLVPGQDWEDYRVPAGGVSCYSSSDLKTWNNEGVVLSPELTDTSNALHTSKVIERPKVIYNNKTKTFVMWMHLDRNDYSLAHAGVAISDKPTGPFHYVSSLRPNGNMSRDMTLFKDDDESAYLIYSSENNETMHVCKLSDDYLSPTTADNRIFVKESREAPAMFKYHSIYYLITSACTGWSPNKAMYAMATHPLQTWTISGNPCVGNGADATFNSQSTFILPLRDQKDRFIFMADQWNKTDLKKSTYLWLPLRVSDDKVIIRWSDKLSF